MTTPYGQNKRLLRPYIRAAADLRLTIERNYLDYESDRGEAPGRIVYLYDANVVRLFLNPYRETRHFQSFGQSHRPDVLGGTALITSEFLFSRNLSGQNGVPAYLSEAHAEDLANIVSRIRYEINDMSEQSFDRGRVSDVRRLASAALRGDVGQAEAIRELGALVPQLLDFFFNGAVHEARQLRRLLNDDLIRPLRLLPEATAEVLEPDEVAVQVWLEMIMSQRRFIPEKREVLLAKAERDARTLVQVQALNEQARAIGDPTKYVLVTTDRRMRRAYNRWFYANPENRFEDYALRQPLQYVPLLNSEQMRQSTGGSELIEQVRNAFDSLMQAVQEDGGDYLRTLAALADPGSFDGDEKFSAHERGLLRGLKGSAFNMIGEIEQRWEEASRGALLLNASVIQDHSTRGWASVLEVLEDAKDMKSGIVSYLEDLLDQLDATHATFVIEGFIKLRRPGASRGAQRLWPPLLIDTSNPNLVALAAAGSIDQVAFEVEAASKNSRRDPVRKSNIDAFETSACVAFRLGQWTMVSQFCRRARSEDPDNIGGNSVKPLAAAELMLLEAATSKFRLDDDKAKEGHNLLDQAMEYYWRRDDRLGMLRVRVERVALQLAVTCWLAQQLHSGYRVSMRTQQAFASACGELELAFNAFKGQELTFKSPLLLSDLNDYLTYQAYKAVAVGRRLLPSRGDRLASEWMRERLDALPPSERLLSLPTFAVYADFLNFTSTTERGQRIALARRLTERQLKGTLGSPDKSEEWLIGQIGRWMDAEA